MADIHGVWPDEFAVLADLVSASIDRGADLGASVAVTLGGETVVDLWGGWADQAETIPWQADTITNVWSTTKTMTSLSALTLASRGLLDVHAPVAEYWPEFAANGKQGVLVKQVMSHTSGVSAWEQPVQTADLYDQTAAAAKLANQAPWWEPGSASGYHTLNQGHLMGEIVRRVDGRSLGTFFAEEIAEPLGADFHIGLDPAHDHRVANVVPPPSAPVDIGLLDPQSPAYKTFTGPAPDAEAAWTDGWRRAEIGAANGHGNARSVAHIQAAVANGGEVAGVRLLSAEAIELIFEEQANGKDLVLGVPARFGIGYGLTDPVATPELPAGRICYWGGWGGSRIIIDCDRRMTVAYVMNKMQAGVGGDERYQAIIRAVYALSG